MRKSRIKILIDKKLVALIEEDPDKFFSKLKDLSITGPDWSKLTLLTMQPNGPTVEVGFFEDAKAFFLTYTKRTLRNTDPSIKLICFSRERTDEWRSFIPPTLIGTNLKTKVRRK